MGTAIGPRLSGARLGFGLQLAPSVKEELTVGMATANGGIVLCRMQVRISDREPGVAVGMSVSPLATASEDSQG